MDELVFNNKKVILEIAKAMGFLLVEDLWDDEGYLTFQLIGELHEKELTLTWNKDEHISHNFAVASKILFRAGQKAKFYQISTLPYIAL
jgi:hypothetical protein